MKKSVKGYIMAQVRKPLPPPSKIRPSGKLYNRRDGKVNAY